MNYWLHRCAYQGGHEILDAEHRLTIGFSDCANNPEMIESIQKGDGETFDKVYKAVYTGEIWRARWSLWYFVCEMKEGDVVVVPRYGGFSVCRLVGHPLVSERRNAADIGWEWYVEIIANMCAPRDSYATPALLSRMKCRQTTINIGDLSGDVEAAIKRFRENKPFSLPMELAEKCHELLDLIGGSPDHFERVIRDYFIRLGANAEILPKNAAEKIGDCDISAVFTPLRLTISVQAKKHWGETGEWAVRQIVDYAKDKAEKANADDPNWTYANWVISFADDFSSEAKKLAQESGVVLVNGVDFCRMLVANGLGF